MWACAITNSTGAPINLSASAQILNIATQLLRSLTTPANKKVHHHLNHWISIRIFTNACDSIHNKIHRPCRLRAQMGIWRLSQWNLLICTLHSVSVFETLTGRKLLDKLCQALRGDSVSICIIHEQVALPTCIVLQMITSDICILFKQPTTSTTHFWAPQLQVRMCPLYSMLWITVLRQPISLARNLVKLTFDFWNCVCNQILIQCDTQVSKPWRKTSRVRASKPAYVQCWLPLGWFWCSQN